MAESETTELDVRPVSPRELSLKALSEFDLANQDPLMNWLNPNRFDQIQRCAAVLTRTDMVPDQFKSTPEKNNTANCFIGLQQAFQLGLAPLAFLQKCYIVHGKPGVEAQVVIALINTRGPFRGALKYEWRSEQGKDDWGCRCFATHKEGHVCYGPWVDWKMVKAEGWLGKTGSKWQSMPEVMFGYRSATLFGRLHCPEVLLGIETVDELRDYDAPQTVIVEKIPYDAGNNPVIMMKFKDALSAIQVPLPAAREKAQAMFGVERLEALTANQARELVEALRIVNAPLADAPEAKPAPTMPPAQETPSVATEVTSAATRLRRIELDSSKVPQDVKDAMVKMGFKSRNKNVFDGPENSETDQFCQDSLGQPWFVEGRYHTP